MAEEPVSGNIHTRTEIPAYCPRCQIGKLQPRIYRDDELVAGQLPYDHNQWKQCYHCGHLVPVYDIPVEGQLTTDVERIDSKFPRQVEGVEHYEKPKHRRGFNERLDNDKKQGEIKDPEVKAALKKGAKLTSYSEK